MEKSLQIVLVRDVDGKTFWDALIDETKIFIIIFDILAKFQRIIINRLRYSISFQNMRKKQHNFYEKYVWKNHGIWPYAQKQIHFFLYF